MSLSPLFEEAFVVVAHAFVALLALGLGAAQLVGSKGTRSHRVIGYVWVFAMMFVALSSFWIHDLRLLGPFSPIHILSVLVAVNVPIAVLAARKGNIKKHKAYMLSLFFLGLVVTGLFTLLPGRVMHDVLFGVQ